MALRFYNTLARKAEEFAPLEDGKVRLYTCGPTVYDYAHIGNFRSYVFADVLRKVLELNGLKVDHVMNITDVDDKTIKRSKEQGKSLKAFCDAYTDAFFEDLEQLGIHPSGFTALPRATETIPEMVAIVEGLLENGIAYRSDDGSVYFSISKFKDYGKLAGLDKTQLKAGASGRVSADEYDKDNVQDFVLWKSWTEDDGDVFWETSLGKGRPGWHIECSAMSMKFLGEHLDLHTGGIDLVFPHHQNEIAQSEAYTGKQFVQSWMHCAHLIVEGKKMSKSLGNFYTLRDILNKGYSPSAVRYLLLSAHYRSQLNFTFDALKAAENSVARLNNLIFALKNYSDRDTVSESGIIPSIKEVVVLLKKDFDESLAADLNTPKALAAMFELVSAVNTIIHNNGISDSEAKLILDALSYFDSVLGVMDFSQKELPSGILEKIEQRNQARQEKDWKTADRLRDELEAEGILLEDTPHGTVWKLKK